VASRPRLSVVIPCYDAEATLGTQLAALAAQRWEGSWEVVIADNGSTDGSPRVAESFRHRLPALRWVDASDRRGPGHARNVGAAAAEGELLLFCDADDEVAPGWLAAMAGALAEHRFVASRYDASRLNPEAVQAIHGTPQAEGLNPYTYPPYLPHAGGGGLGVQRAVHEAVGGFDEELPALEDTDYCWRIQRSGVALVFVPDALVHIRYRPTLAGVFRQGLVYGEHNVLIYKRYRPLGMPRLGVLPGLLRLAKLVLTLPQVVRRDTRAGWIWQAGWRLGRLKGCWKHRVLAP
jgi:glycosyltransferase involved in cell wall biosynthesis